MPKFLTVKKTFPCGEARVNNLLEQVLRHYNQCNHSECKARAKKFQAFFTEGEQRDAI